MKIGSTTFALCALLGCANGFQPIATKLGRQNPTAAATTTTTSIGLFSFGKKEEEIVADTTGSGGFFSFLQNDQKTVPATMSIAADDDDDSWTDFGKSPFSYAYAGTWLALMSFGFVFAPGELGSAEDNAMIQRIIENPADPGINPFYYAVFNLFVLIPFVLGCTIAPRASNKGIPAGPPLFLSAFIAYFVMGPYLALRKTPKDTIVDPSTELGWVTRNIWENKIFNYGVVAFGLLCLTSGAPGLEDPAASLEGFVDIVQTSRFASVSMADLSLITLILTKEVADDYKIRCNPENVEKAPLIGASTALLPLLGSAIYCAVRPSFPSEEEA